KLVTGVQTCALPIYPDPRDPALRTLVVAPARAGDGRRGTPARRRSGSHPRHRCRQPRQAADRGEAPVRPRADGRGSMTADALPTIASVSGRIGLVEWNPVDCFAGRRV